LAARLCGTPGLESLEYFRMDGGSDGGLGRPGPGLAPGSAAHLHALLALEDRAARLRQAQRAVGFVVGTCVAERHQLAEHAAPGRLVQVRADAEHAELGVIPLLDAVGGLAAQHIDEVHGAEALAGAVDARERLARGVGRIPGLRRIETGIAVPAGWAFLAKVV